MSMSPPQVLGLPEANINAWVDANNGNDANPGTQAKPLKTMGAAIARQPLTWFKDNVIWLKPGSYAMDSPGTVFDPTFGRPLGSTGSPLAIIAAEPKVCLPQTSATSSTVSTITVQTATWTPDEFRGMTLETLSSSGQPDQRTTIATNTGIKLYLMRPLSLSQTQLFRIIGATADTELLFTNPAAAVLPFSVGGLGLRDLQLRFSAGGSFSIVEGTSLIAVSGCVLDMGGGTVNIRRGAHVICGTQFAGQWANSDQGIPLFPAAWDCASYFRNSPSINVDTDSELRNGVVADNVAFAIGRGSSFRATSPNFRNVTVTGTEGAAIHFVGLAATPNRLDGQRTSDAQAGIVNLASRASLLLSGPTSIANSGGYGLVVDKMSYADLTSATGVLSGAGHVGTGVKVDRGGQVDLNVATLPSITGVAGDIKIGGFPALPWSAFDPATSMVDPALLCRATSR